MPTEDVRELELVRTVVTTLAGPNANPNVAALHRVKARVDAAGRIAPVRSRPRLWRVMVPAVAGAAVIAVALTVSMLMVGPATSRQPEHQPASQITSGPASQSYLPPLRVPYVVTATFGKQSGAFHYGVDMACPEGTPFYAVGPGTVTAAGDRGGRGLAVTLDLGGGIEIIYAQASALAVTVGTHVAAGEVLGYVGNTGYSTGDHLHFEVLVNGTEQDPVPFMRDHGIDIIAASNG